MSRDPEGFGPFRTKMEGAGLAPIAIDTFAHYFDLLRKGETGLLTQADIAPVEKVPAYEDLTGHEDAGAQALNRAVVIKLNGGLGTSMGMTRAKSLLPVKEGRSFLDIIAGQVLHLRRTHDCNLPLVLMNSFRTRDDSLQALSRHEGLASGVPLDFLQHKVPRIRVDDLAPLEWPADANAEWCPPGHGDIYTALQTSGMLETLRNQGIDYAFVSNADNLGAVLDLNLLGWFAGKEVPFAMEVARRTEADKKGGHLALLANGRLTLRESAQCPDEEKDDFQNIEKYRFFNTNSLWLNLGALEKTLKENDSVLGLPMIRNQKTADSGDPASPKVYQLETAMGAAISSFDNAQAVVVPRSRFAPVKTTNDLLALWSDQYVLTEESRMLPVDESRLRKLVVDLDSRYFKGIDDFSDRFADGAPSLIDCERLEVRGDFRFQEGVVARGKVSMQNDGSEQAIVKKGEVLEG